MSIPAVSLLANARLFEASPDHVEDGKRVGFLHPGKAAAFGRLMSVFGQRDPIKVVANDKRADRPWKLVTGRHRLEGARIEGLTIHAIEVFGTPEELADMESSENLHRRPLGPIERAMFVQSLAQAAQERIAREHGNLKQHQLAAKARWARVKAGEITPQAAIADETEDAVDKMSTACGWQEEAAAELGLSKKEVQRSLTLCRLIVEPFPDLVEPLAKHPVVGENGKQLREIADVKDVAARRKVIEMLLEDAELSVDEAKVRLGIGLTGAAGAATPLAHQKFVDAVTGNLGRLTHTLQKRHLPEIVRALKTEEVKRQMRDLLNAELGDAAREAGALVPAVSIRQSCKPGYIACLEDGTRHINLTRHIAKLGMTPAEYRARWQLPLDYPMLAPNYSNDRRVAWHERVRARRAATKNAEAAHAG